MSTEDKRPATRDDGFRLRNRLIARRIIALIGLTQRSGAPAYRRATGLSDAEWRVVHQVGVHAPVLLTQIAALMSRDKGQVSRTVARLVDRGVLRRASRRSVLELSSRGRNIFGRIVRLAGARNTALIRGLTDAEVRKLPTLLARLQGEARRLAENAASVRGSLALPASRQALLAARLTDREEIRTRQRDARPRDRLILPDFINLLNLLRSSAAAVYRQATRLSNVERQVVSRVAEAGSVTLIELVSDLNRDKSQVGRAVKRLVALGHVAAYKIGGGRHVRLVITRSGRSVYQRAARVALARNAKLLEVISAAERRALFSILDRLITNAEGLLSRERGRRAT